jgi:hypothetical protein
MIAVITDQTALEAFLSDHALLGLILLIAAGVFWWLRPEGRL